MTQRSTSGEVSHPIISAVSIYYGACAFNIKKLFINLVKIVNYRCVARSIRGRAV